VPDPRAKIVVINTIGGNPEINFFAIATQGLPQLLLIDESKITPIHNETETSQLILSRVIVNGEPAIIPDLDALEGMLLACKKTWMKVAEKINA
jgi:chemosensory pili system protein ChpC